MKEYIVQAIAQETIDSFDAHNAPGLIRCKECKHFDKSFSYCATRGYCDISSIRHDDDWFCADGERINKCCGNCDIYDREEQECVYLQAKRDEDSEACDNWEEHS